MRPNRLMCGLYQPTPQPRLADHCWGWSGSPLFDIFVRNFRFGVGVLPSVHVQFKCLSFKLS